MHSNISMYILSFFLSWNKRKNEELRKMSGEVELLVIHYKVTFNDCRKNTNLCYELKQGIFQMVLT